MKPVPTFLSRALLLSVMLGAVSLHQPSRSNASEYTDAYDRLCEHMKGCARREMEASGGMTDAMKAMIDQQLEVMCQGIEDAYSGAVAYPDLVSMAAECMDSMAALSCEELMRSDDGHRTPQCIALQERTDALSQ